MIQTILLISAAACLAWLVLRLFPRNQVIRKNGFPRVGPYHAVSIHPGTSVCQPAKELLHKRFLSGEAPLLPLAGCTAQRCRCVYQHHSDRRTGDGDRRANGSAAQSIFQARQDGERRHSLGRRGSDHDDNLSLA